MRARGRRRASIEVAVALAAAWLGPVAAARATVVQSYGSPAARPAVAANPRTQTEYAFWQGAGGRIQEAWGSGRWQGPLRTGWSSASAPAAAVGANGSQYVFWLGADGDLYEAWHTNRWHGPVDTGWSANSAPAVAVDPRNDHQYVFFEGLNGDLYEAWHTDRWHGPVDTGWRSSSGASVAVTNDGHQYVWWQGANGDLYEAWYTNRWHGPADMGWQSSSAPAIAVNPRGAEQYVFWLGTNGDVWEASYVRGWRAAVDRGWRSSSAPAAAATQGGQLYVLWQGAGGAVQRAVYERGRWHGPQRTAWAVHTPQLAGCVPSGSSWVFSGPASQRVIALTFDDGPWYDTPQFLDILEREHVPATFFEIGEQISQYGQGGAIERRMLADGDIVGDHTWNHANVSGGGSFAAGEIGQTAAAIRAATGGFEPCLFRAPGGAVGPGLLSVARSMGFLTIQWDIDPRDWATPGTNAIYDNVIANAHPGAIVIQHDGGGNRTETLAALPREIATLRSEGYRFENVAQLLGLRLRFR